MVAHSVGHATFGVAAGAFGVGAPPLSAGTLQVIWPLLMNPGIRGDTTAPLDPFAGNSQRLVQKFMPLQLWWTFGAYAS